MKITLQSSTSSVVQWYDTGLGSLRLPVQIPLQEIILFTILQKQRLAYIQINHVGSEIKIDRKQKQEENAKGRYPRMHPNIWLQHLNLEID